MTVLNLLSLTWQPAGILTSSSDNKINNNNNNNNNENNVVASRNVDHHLQCQLYTTEVHAEVSMRLA